MTNERIDQVPKGMDRPAEIKKFYVTTPIYYVNDVPHIGHAYTTVAADCVARYRRLKGDEVLFLTGTDEHGQKVEKAASNAGVGPLEFADRVVVRFRELWETLDISNDDFIRTTEKRHKLAAARLWETVAEKGDIYLGEYEDWYCTPCENFLTETHLREGKCPDCNRAVDKLREPSYFFRLSKYASPLLEHISANPGFIRPESKRNEIVSFIREGLRDLSVSRTTFSWGVPVPNGPGHVMYVWFDALTNYLTAAGYPDSSGDGFWPADLHLIGKDILRFHAVYWPAFLMSAGLPLPRSVFAHGWWTVDGNKMSKSKGNVVDPVEVIERFGADQFRYFLLREVPFGLDGDFSLQALKGRVNSDLANDLGNLLSRSVTMIEKYRGGTVPGPEPSENPGPIGSLIRDLNNLPREFDGLMASLRFSDALAATWRFIGALNVYIESSAPWRMAKEGADAPLSNVLYNLAEGLRIIALYMYPFMPGSAERIWEQIGMGRKIEGIDNFDVETIWDASGDKVAGNRVKKGSALFPRMAD